MSRTECRIKFLQNQRCRAKIALHPPKSRCRTFLRTPPSHFPVSFAPGKGPGGGGGVAAGWWRYRSTFGFRKRIALQGGVAATVTPVALHCATKTKDQQRKKSKMFEERFYELWFKQGCNFFLLTIGSFLHNGTFPKGPKIEKIQDRPPGLKFSIEIENFNLDPQQTPIICGEF